jgi:hypothetical protein
MHVRILLLVVLLLVGFGASNAADPREGGRTVSSRTLGPAPPTDSTQVEEPPHSETPTNPTDDELGQLELLGYVNTVAVKPGAPSKGGVVVHSQTQAVSGFNFFNARHERAATLINMKGDVVHRWQSDATGRVFQEYQERYPQQVPGYLEGWNYVELLADGGILAIGTHHSILRLDRESKLVWKRDLAVHHDLDVGVDGRIYTLVDSLRTVEIDGALVTFQENAVAVLSSAGVMERSYSLYDAFSDSEWQPLLAQSLGRVASANKARARRLGSGVVVGAEGTKTLRQLYEEASRGEIEEDAGIKNVLFHNRAEDIFHPNSVQVLRAGEPGLWKAGDLLVSILRYDMVMVIDHETGGIVWSYGPGELQQPHHATYLPSGEILIFDNGPHRGYSRVVRVSPLTREIVWQYQAEPKEAFFSGQRGGAQQLPGGNVLVANTNSGNAFEVTPSGEKVWEFFTEEVRPGKRAALYRIRRYSEAEIEAWLGIIDIIPDLPTTKLNAISIIGMGNGLKLPM